MRGPDGARRGETAGELRALGKVLRKTRKSLKLSATSVAEAAGVSRVTLHRIEGGQPSVAMGSYADVAAALGLKLEVLPQEDAPERMNVPSVPVEIVVSRYPELSRLAWHVKEGATLRPAEALGIYERHGKHLEEESLSEEEGELLKNLRAAWGPVDV